VGEAICYAIIVESILSLFMLNAKFHLVISVLLGLLLCSCQKRPFAHMGVHGQILNTKTNQPVEADVELAVVCDPSTCGHSQSYGNTMSDENGNFEIKSNAQWNGKEYFLTIHYIDSTNSVHFKTLILQISKNQNLDLGEIRL
jgi:hypothetical protein